MAKRKQEEEEHDEFIVLFTALSMILLAFFILLNTMATIDPMRSRKAMDSLVGTFGIMTGNQEGDVVDLSEQERREHMVMAMIAAFKDENRYPGMNASMREDGVIAISMESDIFFASSSWHLDPNHFDALDHIAAIARQSNYSTRVVGHTDSMGGGAVSNLRLSAARAASVRRFLEHSANFEPGKIVSVGVGSSQPREDLRRAPSDPRHRRVEIFIHIAEPSEQ